MNPYRSFSVSFVLLIVQANLFGQCAFPDFEEFPTTGLSCIDVDGGTILVGDHANSDNFGSVVLYEQVSGIWQEVDRIQALDVAQFDAFGLSADLDNNRLAVGSPDHDATGDRMGAVYVFEKHQETGAWVETAKLTTTVGFSERLGDLVALDGDTLAAATGVRQDVLMYELQDGDWVNTQEIVTIGAEVMELADDVLVVGNQLIANGRGTVEIWRRLGSTWSREKTLVYGLDGEVDDGFGYSINLQGSFLAIGIPGRTGNTGAVQIYQNVGSDWLLVQELTRAYPVPEQRFGESVLLSGNQVFVGIAEEEDYRKAIAVYTNTGQGWEFDGEITNPKGNTTSFGATLGVVGESIMASATNGTNWVGIWLFESESLGLGLQPPRVSFQETVSVCLCNAVPGTPFLYAVTAFGSDPFFIPLLIDVADAEGAFEIQYDLPLIGNMTIDHVIFGFDTPNGKLTTTNTAVMTIE